MNQKDQQHFASQLEAVMALYGRTMTPAVLEIWWDALQHLDFPAVSEALKRHTQNPDAGMFPPKPADVIRLMGGTSNDRALIAWAKVKKAIGSVGAWNSVVFDDAGIHAAIDQMGGWSSLCQSDEEELPFRAKEFENRYRTFLFHPTADYPKKLVGIAETSNAAGGQPVDAPLTIGNVDHCRLVYRGGSAPQKLGVLSMKAPENTLEPLRLAVSN